MALSGETATVAYSESMSHEVQIADGNNLSTSPTTDNGLNTSTTSDVEYIDIEFELPFLMTICVIGLLGNALVVTVYTRRKFRRSNAAMYILNLAATDIAALIVIVFHITEFYATTWPVLWAYNAQCQVQRLARFVCFNSTVFTMVAISVDRYFAVRNPLAFKMKFTTTRTKIVILIVWLISIVAAIPVAFMFQSVYRGSGNVVTYPGKLPWACQVIVPFGPWWSDFKPIYLNVLLFYVPVIITSYIYVRIFIYVRRSTIFLRKNLTNSAPIPAHARNAHWKTGKSLLYVFIVFILCFAPFATYHIVQEYFSTSLHAELKNLALLLPYFNSCLNPLVYSFSNTTFRRAAKKILRLDRLRHISKKNLGTLNTYPTPSMGRAGNHRAAAEKFGITFTYDPASSPGQSPKLALRTMGDGPRIPEHIEGHSQL